MGTNPNGLSFSGVTVSLASARLILSLFGFSSVFSFAGASPTPGSNPAAVSAQTRSAVRMLQGTYRIRPVRNPSACVDVAGGYRDNGVAIQSYSCNGTAAQSWTFVPVAGPVANLYEIIPDISHACLVLAGNSPKNGTKMTQWRCPAIPQPGQMWQLFQVGVNVQVTSFSSGRCLDVPNGDSSNGRQLQQWDCDRGNPNQLWNLTLLSAQGVAAPPVRLPTPKVASTTVAQANPFTVVEGQSVVLTAHTAGGSVIPAGIATFFCDGKSLGAIALDEKGSASLNTPALASGSHAMSAHYVGSSSYNESFSPVVQVTVTSPPTGEQAGQADAFVDSVGVQTHWNYDDTGYTTLFPHLVSELKASGIRHLRDGLWNWDPGTRYTAEHRVLAAAGLKTTYGLSLDYSMTPQIIQSIAAAVGDVEALEAPNECDAGTNCGATGLAGINNVVAFMPYLAAAGKALGVPVIGPSFMMPESYVSAGDLSSRMSFSNLHVYYGGRNPGSEGWGGGDGHGNRYGSLNFWMDQVNQQSVLPVQITETGYMVQTITSTPYTLPEAVAASYTPRTLLLDFNRGVHRTFLYELIDEASSPGYGLLRIDGTEKPAFLAVKGLLNILSDPGGSFLPGKLSYTLLNGDSTINHTLLQKRDGSFWLVLWSEQCSYDPATNQAVPIAQKNIVLTVAGNVTPKQIVRFDSTGNVATSSISTVAPLALTISDQLTMIHLTP